MASLWHSCHFCILLLAMDHVHTFEVHCTPVKFIRDKDRNWVSARWLSKPMIHLGYVKHTATHVALAVAALGSRTGDCIWLYYPQFPPTFPFVPTNITRTIVLHCGQELPSPEERSPRENHKPMYFT